MPCTPVQRSDGAVDRRARAVDLTGQLLAQPAGQRLRQWRLFAQQARERAHALLQIPGQRPDASAGEARRQQQLARHALQPAQLRDEPLVPSQEGDGIAQFVQGPQGSLAHGQDLSMP